MKLLTPHNYGKQSTFAFISFNKTGQILISQNLSKKLAISEKINISFCYDEKTNTYYLGVTPKGNVGFPFSFYKNKTYLLAYSRKLTDEVIKNSGGLPPNISSQRFRVHTDVPVRNFGMDLYKMTKA